MFFRFQDSSKSPSCAARGESILLLCDDEQQSRWGFSMNRSVQARSSVGERYIDIVEVVSSILSAPTIFPCRGSLKSSHVSNSKDEKVIRSFGKNDLKTIFCLAAPSGRRANIAAALSSFKISKMRFSLGKFDCLASPSARIFNFSAAS